MILSRRKISLSYIGESSRCLENRVREHCSHVTSAIYQHSVSSNHPIANISHFKIIDQDNKQVGREAREAIHIRTNKLALHHNVGKMYILEIFNNFLEQMELPTSLTKWETQTNHKIISTFHSKQQVFQSSVFVFGKLSTMNITTHPTGIPPCQQ